MVTFGLFRDLEGCEVEEGLFLPSVLYLCDAHRDEGPFSEDFRNPGYLICGCRVADALPVGMEN